MKKKKRTGTLSRAAQVASSINSVMGKPLLKLGSDEQFNVIRIPTGSLVVDRITGGGFALGRHVELYGDENCVAPDTKILTAGLYWVSAGDLNIGDAIVGFDEYPESGRGKQRKYKKSLVTSNDRKMLDCYEIKTDKGTTTIASESHLWLARNKHGNNTTKWVDWKTTRDLNVGDRIIWLGHPWEDSIDPVAEAYLAGLFDGEGTLDKSALAKGYHNNRMTFNQVHEEVTEYALALLEELGFTASCKIKPSPINNPHWKPQNVITVKGGVYETMRFLAQVNPVRWNDAMEVFWEGCAVTRKGRAEYAGDSYATVESIKFVGEREVCAIGTSTKTLITDGLLSHNSCKSFISQTTMALSQQRGNLCALVDPEKTFDPDWFRHLGGIPEELLLFQPEGEKWSADDAVGVMMLLAQYSEEDSIEVITVDSVAAMVPQEEIERDPRKAERIGSQARLMSRALRRITTMNKRTLFIWTNQERMKIGIMFGNPKTTSGGRALAYYATSRIEFKKTLPVKEKMKKAQRGELKEKEVKVGTWIQVRSEKEKSTHPYMTGEFMFDNKGGKIDLASEIIQLGLEDEIIVRSGNTFTYEDIDGEIWSGNNSKFRGILADQDDLRSEIVEAIQDQTVELSRVGDPSG
jgi:recombination protein RecA